MSKIDKLLEAIYRYGSIPMPESLLGPKGGPAEWRVVMLTGPIPNMGGKLFHHRKRFWRRGEGDEVIGENVLFDDTQWGHFTLRLWAGALLIDYNTNANGVSRRIRDLVRTTPDPNLLIGKFHLVWRSKPRFLGYFTLARRAPAPRCQLPNGSSGDR